MKIYGKSIQLNQLFFLVIYYGFAQYLPVSNTFWGKFTCSKIIRRFCCKHLFLSMGKNVNIERKAQFGSGLGIEIGNNSGLGIRCVVPSDIKIGNDVMMGPDCHIFGQNHCFDRIDIPMWKQGSTGRENRTVIDDDVWIGQYVTFTVGRHVSKGTVIGSCTLLCKDFPEYSIIGGNPSRLIKSRIKIDEKA